jgi:DNA-directed RNA polymerase specialized sigma24 family protein
VRRHGSIAFRTAWVITGSGADAEEAAQDAFVKAHAAFGRFREGAPLRPWLLTIVANEARNRVKSAGRRERLVLRVAEERLFRPLRATSSPISRIFEHSYGAANAYGTEPDDGYGLPTMRDCASSTSMAAAPTHSTSVVARTSPPNG